MKKHLNKIIFLLVLTGVLVWVLLYMSALVEGKIQTISALNLEVKNSSILPDKDLLIEKTESLEYKNNQLNSYLINEENPIEFIEFIESLASTSGLGFNVNKVENKDINKTISVSDGSSQIRIGGEITVEMTVDGSLSNIRDFISRMENVQKEAYVQAVKINKQGEESLNDWVAILTIKGVAN